MENNEYFDKTQMIRCKQMICYVSIFGRSINYFKVEVIVVFFSFFEQSVKLIKLKTKTRKSSINISLSTFTILSL